MKFFIFIIVYPIIWILSILPMPILYGISNFFYFLLFYVFGYRKKVVLDNLKLAFPEKDEDQLKTIRKKFYQHFTDLIVESVKAFTMGK